jgi:hypothetical protein
MSINEKKDLHIDIILNCILVNEGVRPAMLVQPADYNEATHDDQKTKSIIVKIKEQFPNLILSTDYEKYQGVIVSKTNYNGRKDISLEEMGKILGYPCYKDFDNIDDENISYNISVYVKDTGNNRIQIFSNKCKDEKNIKEFKDIEERAKIAFKKEEYKSILNGIEVKEIYVETSPVIPTQIIINKLLKNEKLEQNEIDKVQNILYNFGFSMELQFYFLDNFQYNNPIHKGILLELLLKNKHDTLSPFFPLQKYPTELKKVDEITKAWEMDLLEILIETSEKTDEIKNTGMFNSFKKFFNIKGGNKKTKRGIKFLSNRKTRSSKKK